MGIWKLPKKRLQIISLPLINENDSIEFKAHKNPTFHRPPPRYNDASMIKALEEKALEGPQHMQTYSLN